ncbi:MAG: ribonucleoside-diphosphate reductase, adenosylcobalamin-dependent, partial [Prevotella sp.]|nr:ribonucleoside-diphosphate reductase, adenosylcobalamin-dependent [Prevotella sp.]
MDYDIYSYEDVYEQAMKHFKDNTEAVNLWLSKIALKDSNGNLCERTPDDSLRRVAHEIARVECRYSDPLQEETIYELFKDFRTAVPSTSLLAGIGDRYHISP